MKFRVRDNLLVIVVFIFLLIQPALSYIYSKDFFNALPEMTWNGLRTGEYGTKLEKALNDESFFAKVSNEKYRQVLYKFFYRLNDNVMIGKNHFLFLPGSTREMAPNQYQKDVPKILENINAFKGLLDERGIPFMIAVLPTRGKVFPDYAYPSKAVPPNRKEYFDKVFEALDREGIAYYRMEEDLIKLRDELERPPYYRVDHHWTFEATEKLAPKFVENWQRLHGPLSPRPEYKRVYEYEWKDVINEYNNVVNKLGFSRGTVPSIYKELQKDPMFRPKKHIEKTEGRLMLLSSSYGGYGPVEFISNELGYRMPFYVVHSQPIKFMSSQFIMRNLSDPEKYGLPSGMIWILSENDFQGTLQDSVSYAEPIPPQDLAALEFKITDAVGAELLSSSSVKQIGNSMRVKFKLKKKQKEVVLQINHDSGKDYSHSRLHFGGKQYHIVHDGERNAFRIELPEASREFEIRIDSGRLEKKRDFEFGVFL